MEELFSLAAIFGLSLLIIIKSDQQSIHILKGKQHRAGLDQRIAERVYRSHTSVLSAASFALGFAALGLAVILLAKANPLYPWPALIGLALAAYGIWGRLKSFRKADRELGNSTRSQT